MTHKYINCYILLKIFSMILFSEGYLHSSFYDYYNAKVSKKNNYENIFSFFFQKYFHVKINTLCLHQLIIIIIAMKKGTVKFFNNSKGYGFITDEESKNEYFVHISGIIDEINEGDEVEFELKEGKKGLNAVNVKLV